MEWFLPALGSLVFYGFWAFFPKIASLTINPKSFLFYNVIGSVVVNFIIFFVMKSRLQFEMKGFIFTLSCFFILIWIFLLFYINYKTNDNIIFYQSELLDQLEKKEKIDFIVTGLKIIAKNSKTKEEFIKNLEISNIPLRELIMILNKNK